MLMPGSTARVARQRDAVTIDLLGGIVAGLAVVLALLVIAAAVRPAAAAAATAVCACVGL